MPKAKKEKLSLSLFVILLVIFTLVLVFFAISTEIFWYVIRFLVDLIDEYLCQIMPLWLVFILVLGFDISWIVLMVRWSGLKNIRVKIFITWVVIVMSALVLFALIGLAILNSIGTIS
jgi:hypothetical protein